VGAGKGSVASFGDIRPSCKPHFLHLARRHDYREACAGRSEAGIKHLF
jgi:hypothetical protein